MGNVATGESFWVSDLVSINEIATTRKKRRKALDVCLAEFWVDDDIGRLERVDDGSDHGWEMWKWKR